MNKKTILFLFSIIFSFSSFGQTIIYVTPTGNGNQNGSTWANAKTLDQAVITATTNSELRLKQGFYPVTSNILLNKKLIIKGGYNGTNNTLRNPDTTPSILDGGDSVNILESTTSARQSVLDGLTIQNGYARKYPSTNDVTTSAGVSIRFNGAIIKNCKFLNNTTRNRIGAAALYLWNCDTIVIENCIFDNNRVIDDSTRSAHYGGSAIQVRFGENTKIIDCIFTNNYSFYDAGAVLAWGDKIEINNCRFDNNSTELQAGALLLWGAENMVHGCTFSNNTTLGTGGAIKINQFEGNIVNCSFENNKAKRGGAIFTSHAPSNIINCNFNNNSATELGGAFCNILSTVSNKITNCIFLNNNALDGGAIYNSQSQRNHLLVSNSVFSKNNAADSGGVITNIGRAVMLNCNFVNNQSTAITFRAIDSDTTDFLQPFTKIYNSIFYLNKSNSRSSNPDISFIYSRNNNFVGYENTPHFQGNLFQFNPYGLNNIKGIKPQFINDTTNFQLKEFSPAINYGIDSFFNNYSSVNLTTALDLDSNARLKHGRIDAGVYEFQIGPKPPIYEPIDTNSNSIRNVKAHNLSIYPNPTSAIINTTNIKPGSLYVIYNNIGQVIQEGTIRNNRIEVVNLKTGIYLLWVNEGDKQYKTNFIKQ